MLTPYQSIPVYLYEGGGVPLQKWSDSSLNSKNTGVVAEYAVNGTHVAFHGTGQPPENGPEKRPLVP